MYNVKVLNLNWQAALLRYFLLMAVVITGVLLKVPALAFLGLPIFLSVILGVSFERETEKTQNAKMVNLRKTKTAVKKVG